MTIRGKCLAMLAVLLPAQPATADNPRKVAVGPGSPKGALLFKIPPASAHQMLLFIRDVKDGSSSKDYFLVGIKGRATAEGDRFIVTAVPPGRYRLDAVYQQAKWVACLQQKTLIISIDPGKISYLGTLDTRPTLASIQRNARARKQLKAETFQWHFYRTDVAPPRVSGRDPEGLAQAESFVRQNMPRSEATAYLGELRWASYVVLGSSGRADRCDYAYR